MNGEYACEHRVSSISTSDVMQRTAIRVACEHVRTLVFIVDAESANEEPEERLFLQSLCQRLAQKLEDLAGMNAASTEGTGSHAIRIVSAAEQLMRNVETGSIVNAAEMAALACDIAELATCLGLGPLVIDDLVAAVDVVSAPQAGMAVPPITRRSRRQYVRHIIKRKEQHD